MSRYLIILTLLFLAVNENEVRIKVYESPYECAFLRSFSYDKIGRRLVCVTQSSELLVWNDNSKTPVVKKLEKMTGSHAFDRAPMSAVLANGGKEIVLFYIDGRVQVWNVDTGLKVKDLESNRKYFAYAYASPDGELVACLSYAGESNSSAILFWNTRDWTTAGRIESTERINDFCFSGDAKKVFACVGHPTDQKHLGFTGILAWDLKTRQEKGRIEYGTGFPIRIAVSPDARWVATGGGDAGPVAQNSRKLSGHLRLFDWEAKKFLREPYTQADDYVRTVQFSPDSRYLYSGFHSDPSEGRGYTAGIRAFRVGDWVSEWDTTLKLNPIELVISPNGKDILVNDLIGLNIIDAKDGTFRGTKLKFRFYPEDQNRQWKVIIVQMFLMGIFATFFMDLLAGFLAKRKVIYPFISPEAIGRWFLYIFRGRFLHKDINETPALKNEKMWCLISHYLIGVVLAGIYLFLNLIFPVIRNQPWVALIFGIATVILPWFLMLPGIGLGVMASKSSNRSLIIRTNLVNHTVFGLGLFIWIITVHNFFL